MNRTERKNNPRRAAAPSRRCPGPLAALSAAIEAKDRCMHGHSDRVSRLAHRIGLGAGMSEAQADRLAAAGLLHDLGKIGVPESVLAKPGRLTDDEFSLVRRHPQIGHDILSHLPEFADLLPAVLHHHERWDGGGYPARLAGEAIPLPARILAIADAFDAMTSHRSYQPARPVDEAMAEIRAVAGTQFDPDLVPVLGAIDLSLFQDFQIGDATGEGALGLAA